MAGPSPLNSACNCCTSPPSTTLNLEFVSRSQSCSSSACGFIPCTSDGNSICNPDRGSMSEQEKCANKRYLTMTTESGGRVAVTTCTATQQGGCDCKTTCSGSQVTTTKGGGSITDTYKINRPPWPTVTRVCSGTLNNKSTKTYNSDCTTTTKSECTGSSTLNITYDPFLSGGSWSGIRIYSEKCSSSLQSDCSWSGTYSQTGYNSNIDYGGTGKVIGDFTNTSPTSLPCCGVPNVTTTVSPPEGKTTVNYSNENTVKICTPQSLPSFPEFIECEKTPPPLSNGQGRSSEAYKFTSPTNTLETSQQEFKFRLKHQPTGTCYLKVWFEKEILNWKSSTDQCPVLVEDGDPEKEDIDEPYEWEGSGYPCFEDKEKSPTECENAIYSEPKTITAQENQSVSVRIKKWSIIKDYEPDDPDENGCQGCKPNGFPIPNPADCPTCE